MQPKAAKPLLKSISFWGLLMTYVLIFLLMVIRSNGILEGLAMATLGLILFPYLAILIILAVMFITFSIIFTAYLTGRLGNIILAKNQINKPILYTALVFGIVIVLGLILYLILSIPTYLFE